MKPRRAERTTGRPAGQEHGEPGTDQPVHRVHPAQQGQGGMTSAAGEPETGGYQEFLALAAEDLRMLASLHDRELTPELLAELRRAAFCRSGAGPAPAGQRPAVRPLPFSTRRSHAEECDGSAGAIWTCSHADYAAIYLNHTFQVSPLESVWVDPEGLDPSGCNVRDPALVSRITVCRPSDWRKRSDDHLVYAAAVHRPSVDP
jgi:hypothetical protein